MIVKKWIRGHSGVDLIRANNSPANIWYQRLNTNDINRANFNQWMAVTTKVYAQGQDDCIYVVQLLPDNNYYICDRFLANCLEP